MKATLTASLFFLLTLFLVGKEKEEQIDLSKYPLSTVKWGYDIEDIKADKFKITPLKGKVVIVEEFGVKIAACAGRLKALNRLAKKAEREKIPLTIVVIHRQGDVDDERIIKETKNLHPSIIVQADGWLPFEHEGMPHAAIFRPDGTMAWRGKSAERDFDKALKSILAEAEKR